MATDALLSQIKSAAKGYRGTVQGDQIFRVGDNPSRREHVEVTPDDGPGTIGGQMTRGKSVEGMIFSPVLNFNAPVSKETADYTVAQLEAFGRQFAQARYEGYIR
jgi:hypothetical protein